MERPTCFLSGVGSRVRGWIAVLEDKTNEGADDVATQLKQGIAWLALLGLSACSEGKTNSQSVQPVATVNGNELSMLQLNQASKADDLETDQRNARHPDALTVDSMIDEELLVQEALKGRLDKDEAVSMEIDRARRRILARAYLERAVFPATPISAAETRQFYDRNPALFKKHRTFQFISFKIAHDDLNEAVKAAVTSTHSPRALRKILDRRRLSYEIARTTIAAEQLPMNQLEELSHAVVGDVLISPQHDGKVALMSVTQIEETPQGFESAQPMIERYLINVRNEHAMDEHLKQARAGAKITRFKDISSSFALNRGSASANPFAVAVKE